jgi:2,7-dihydroxy-5-methyl-1-naphthoate 7-O-methyltransferase
MAVRTAVTLRIPDRIAEGTTKLDDLAAACEADRDALGRLLRYLAHRRVFAETSPDVFALTKIGELLGDHSGGGHGGFLDLAGFGARMDLAALGMLHSVRTGEPGYATVHGRDLWADLAATPAFRADLNELMHSLHSVTGPETAALYPWHEVGRVADVGGGAGSLLTELLTAHPHLRGMVIDKPEPVATAKQTFAEHGIADRADAVVGDFFQSLPQGADVYVISRALTDWGDADATAILRRMAEAAGASGRVLVLEVLPAEPHVPYQTPFDLKMLVTVGGRERGIDDHAALAASAGLAPSRNFRGTDGLTLMEFVALG